MTEPGDLTPGAVRSCLADAIEGGAFRGVRDALRRLGVGDDALVALVAGVDERPESRTPLLRLREAAFGPTGDPHPHLLARYALLRAASLGITDLARLALPPDVTRLLLEEFVWLTAPAESELEWFEPGGYIFSALCKVVTLRRFPAGQLHWEVGGFPRSAFLRAKGFDRVRLARAVVRMRGFGPVFVPHTPWRRVPLVWLERQQHLSYYRMALAMHHQPAIRGLIAEAWFHAPDTYKVSPHLGWVNRVFHEWGGVVVDTGPAGENSGVFERGATRRRLAEAGQYTPRLGFVVWPRRAMLRWAAHYAGQGVQAAG